MILQTLLMCVMATMVLAVADWPNMKCECNKVCGCFTNLTKGQQIPTDAQIQAKIKNMTDMVAACRVISGMKPMNNINVTKMIACVDTVVKPHFPCPCYDDAMKAAKAVHWHHECHGKGEKEENGDEEDQQDVEFVHPGNAGPQKPDNKDKYPNEIKCNQVKSEEQKPNHNQDMFHDGNQTTHDGETMEQKKKFHQCMLGSSRPPTTVNCNSPKVNCFNRDFCPGIPDKTHPPNAADKKKFMEMVKQFRDDMMACMKH